MTDKDLKDRSAVRECFPQVSMLIEKHSILFPIRLIYKLSTVGFRGKLLAWLSSFLSERIMRVSVHGSYSTWFQMCSGVPQGSVLGPILFLLYVNDLPNWIKCSMRMFAGDTKIWNIIKSDSDWSALQIDINVLVQWSNKWLLHFNTDKCKVMA